MRAFLNTRHAAGPAVEALRIGLEACGFKVVRGVTNDPGAGDVLCTWNRIREGDSAARAFEAAGRPVLVVENAHWGNGFLGRRWLSLARGMHNTAGTFPFGGWDRWDGLGAALAPWRTEGETVVLMQRGIGPAGVAMPRGWSAPADRVRPHPGNRESIPLEHDLAGAARVITWGSGAAVRALMWGIAVESHMPNWIAKCENTDAGRLGMLRSLAWANWTLEELATGEPMRRLM